MTSNEKLAKDWLLYEQLPQELKVDSELGETDDEVRRIVRSNPERGLEIILIMMSYDLSDRTLANIAAGHLEDLIYLHGEKIIGKIEQIARQDAIFRKALGAVWLRKDQSGVWRRIRAVAGPSF